MTVTGPPDDYTDQLRRAVGDLYGEEIMSEWQPIETAPKDGTDFLVLVPFRTKHHQMVGAFAPNGRFVSWPGRWTYDPSHWMPLPSPPPLEEGPSMGEHHGKPIPSYIVDGNGTRFDFARLAVETDGGVELSQLASDECVIAPGLIYRHIR